MQPLFSLILISYYLVLLESDLGASVSTAAFDIVPDGGSDWQAIKA